MDGGWRRKGPGGGGLKREREHAFSARERHGKKKECKMLGHDYNIFETRWYSQSSSRPFGMVAIFVNNKKIFGFPSSKLLQVFWTGVLCSIHSKTESPDTLSHNLAFLWV